ncbi:MAG: ferritin-like domain-containing protein, partial [Nocardioidaceae bacterium]|nr:ferritin-like domain-containing protein [Nocardioidaceae bacterium]
RSHPGTAPLRHADPVAAEPGYTLPADLDSPAAIRRRALALEEGASATYSYLVANASGPTREWAINALLDSAVRGLDFGGRPESLPGL